MVPCGYNLLKGGTNGISGGFTGGIHTEETKQKMSKKAMGHTRSQGIKRSDEYKKKISLLKIGVKRSKEHCEHMSRILKGHIPENLRKAACIYYEIAKKPVICINKITDEIKKFNSISEAGKQLNIHPSNISRYCKNPEKYKNNTIKKWRFRYG
jgi:group I intron endonuclease